MKCWKRDRFVVVGFAPDGAGGLAKLRLARREGGKLVYAGRVGTGWDYKTAREIRTALTPLSRSTSPVCTENLIRIDRVTESPKRQRR